METSSPATPLEALIAVLLGDVGKLHDTVKSLPDDLKAALGPTYSDLSRLLQEAKAVSAAQMKSNSQVKLHDALREAIKKEAGSALAETTLDLRKLANRYDELTRVKPRHLWLCAILTTVLGFGAGALGFYVSYLILV